MEKIEFQGFQKMTTEFGVLPISDSDKSDRQLDILFIHGLGGGSRSTWQHSDTHFFWPEGIVEELPNVGVWTIGYDASQTRWQKDTMPLEDRAGNLVNQLVVKNIGQKPFVLIAHSLGGLLSKLILTQAEISNNESHKQLSKNCLGVIFLAVPHQGSGWSNLLQYFNFAIRSNRILSQLEKDSPFLRLLNQNFSQYCEREGLFCAAFIESNEVRWKRRFFGIPLLPKGIKIVSENSASASFLSLPPVPLDEDHISISKLQSKQALLFENIIQIFQKDPGLLKKKLKTNKKFNDQWFINHALESIENLGSRYTPELNIELDISKKFDVFSRNQLFEEQIKNEFHHFILSCNTLGNGFQHELSQLDQVDNLNALIATLESSFNHIISSKSEKIDIQALLDLCEDFKDILSALSSIEDDHDKNRYSHRNYIVTQSYEIIHEFRRFVSSFLKIANSSVVILTGEAGIGKSHLLADIVSRKIKEKYPCVFLLGQHFNDNTLWSQILNDQIRLGFDNEDELLTELNEIAEEKKERLLFIIDAINEGQGKYVWPEQINGFMRKFCNYPWLGLVLSIRSSYEKLFFPDDTHSKIFISKIIHHGFSNIEYAVSSFFFEQYGINQPSTPLLHTEFGNPLFLKLFCEGIHRSGLKDIPKGYTGISQIISFFIVAINKKLSYPVNFDYPEDHNVVSQTLKKILEIKFNNEYIYTEQVFIPYCQALEVSNNVISKFSNKKLFLNALISEGLLSKNLFWKSNSEHEEGVYFAYERFEDHFRAAYFLDNYSSVEQINRQFSKDDWLQDLFDNFINQGFIEAISIQLPERYGLELYELVNEERKSDSTIRQAFVKSLIWRRYQDIDKKTEEYVKNYILVYEDSFEDFIHMIYSVAVDPDHRYNADFLHNMLIPLSMADRDAEWTIFLHEQNREGSAIRRLIDWAISTDGKENLSNESRLLACKALSWIFTSTNIPLRDYATEGLVALLENNLSTAYKLILLEFDNVNDPYVIERVYASIYGAVLRSESLEYLRLLSEVILGKIFLENEIYPNALVRDYARNIIEYAIYKDLFSPKYRDIITPPYRSNFPNSFPSDQEIDGYEYDYDSKDFKKHYWGRNRIISSMGVEHSRNAYGDFGRYTFQSKLHNWRSSFSANDLSNYACKLIFEEYGYDVEKHGYFDNHASSSRNGRHDNITERIGKKYQWIALYEVLARVSDNHPMDDPSSGWGGEDREYIWYQGAWEPFIRNIDPSVRTRKPSPHTDHQIKDWWHQFKYDDLKTKHLEWLSSSQALPCDSSAISVTDPSGEKWLVLESYQEWDEDIPLGVKKYEYTHKHLWVMLKSVLVKKEDFKTLHHWLQDKHFMGRWFPEGRDNQYEVFSREYYWSPAYLYFLDDHYYGGEQWKEVSEPHSRNERICDVLPTSEGHIWETGSNHEDTPSYLAPVYFIFKKMGLQYTQEVGAWKNESNEIICFDPSVKYGGSSCLLVKQMPFNNFLLENDLHIIWTCLGQKMILDGLSSRFPPGLEFSGVFTTSREGILQGEITKIVNHQQRRR